MSRASNNSSYCGVNLWPDGTAPAKQSHLLPTAQGLRSVPGTMATNEPLIQDPVSGLADLVNRSFQLIPGKEIVVRYIASSYQNDPVRSLLELILFIFAVRTILQNRTRSSRNFVNLSNSDIDYLVKEFEPEPLCTPLSPEEQDDLDGAPQIVGHASSHPMVKAPWMSGTVPRRVKNLASFNFTGMLEASELTVQAKQILREYGVGSCSPPGFYGTSDMHIKLEETIASFLRKEACIVYSQGFSTISSVIPAFCKRGDVIVVDSGVNFSIQKGLQLSRSRLYWYDHHDMSSLEAVLAHLNREQARSRKPLTRRFIVTEALFESDGSMANLPRIVELKKKYKFRMILDESYSVGTVGPTGRGLPELQHVNPDDVDIVVGNLAASFATAGGFCASTKEIVKHQRINGLSFVFSAAMPVMMANGSTVAIQKLMTHPDILAQLRDNTEKAYHVLSQISSITIPSTPGSPLIHVQIRPKAQSEPMSAAGQRRLLRQIMRQALNQDVMVSLGPRLRSIRPELDEGTWANPSLRIAVTSALSPAEMAQAIDVVRASIVSVLGT